MKKLAEHLLLKGYVEKEIISAMISYNLMQSYLCIYVQIFTGTGKRVVIKVVQIL